MCSLLEIDFVKIFTIGLSVSFWSKTSKLSVKTDFTGSESLLWEFGSKFSNEHYGSSSQTGNIYLRFFVYFGDEIF